MRLQHRKYQVLISALVDGEVKEDERHKLEEHVSVCAQCERMLRDFRLLKEATAGTKPHPVNPFYITRLRAALGRAIAVPWGALEIEAKLFAPLFTILLLGLIFLFTMTEKRGATSEEYLFGGRRTLVEQQLLSRPGQVSKDEVLLLTVSTQRREELYGR